MRMNFIVCINWSFVIRWYLYINIIFDLVNGQTARSTQLKCARGKNRVYRFFSFSFAVRTFLLYHLVWSVLFIILEDIALWDRGRALWFLSTLHVHTPCITNIFHSLNCLTHI